MKFDTKILKTMSPLEMILFGLFIVYLVFPIHTPDYMTDAINSPIGLVTIFMVTLFLFVYTNPILGLIYIFVAYELLRRSSNNSNKNTHRGKTTKPQSQTSYVQYTSSDEERNRELHAMNPPAHTTLEEDVVNEMAPIGKGSTVTYVDMPFKPISENTHNAFKL
jgi:hypothetical protein